MEAPGSFKDGSIRSQLSYTTTKLTAPVSPIAVRRHKEPTDLLPFDAALLASRICIGIDIVGPKEFRGVREGDQHARKLVRQKSFVTREILT